MGDDHSARYRGKRFDGGNTHGVLCDSQSVGILRRGSFENRWTGLIVTVADVGLHVDVYTLNVCSAQRSSPVDTHPNCKYGAGVARLPLDLVH
jgi:hypothetical protein